MAQCIDDRVLRGLRSFAALCHSLARGTYFEAIAREREREKKNKDEVKTEGMVLTSSPRRDALAVNKQNF